MTAEQQIDADAGARARTAAALFAIALIVTAAFLSFRPQQTNYTPLTISSPPPVLSATQFVKGGPVMIGRWSNGTFLVSTQLPPPAIDFRGPRRSLRIESGLDQQKRMQDLIDFRASPPVIDLSR
jgi:hypothetical protein